MSIIQKIRTYHAALAIMAILSYLTGEFGIIHSWLGYGVAAIILFRLLWALSGNPNVGLMKFYPSFEGLNFTNAFTHPFVSKFFMLGIAISLISATATGIAIDKGHDIGLSSVQIVGAAQADDDDKEQDGNSGESYFDEALEETHEFFANLMLLFVGMHIPYLLLFKRPLANYMLYLNKPTKK